MIMNDENTTATATELQKDYVDQIASIIKTRCNYFLDLIKYTDDIIKKEIDEEEIDDLYYDVFGFRFSCNDSFKEKIPMLLKDILEDKVKRMLEFYNLILMKNKSIMKDQSIALCVLQLFVEEELLRSSIITKQTSLPKITEDSKLYAAFNDHAWFIFLKKQIQPHLPDYYKKLSTIFVLKNNQEVLSGKKGMGTFLASYVHYKICWNKFGIDLQRQVEGLARRSNVTLKRSSKNISKTEAESEFNKLYDAAPDEDSKILTTYMQELTNFSFKIQSKTRTKDKIIGTAEDFYKTIEEYVEAESVVSKFLNQFVYLENKSEQIKELALAKSMYSKIMRGYLNELNSLHDYCLGVEKNLQSLLNDSKASEFNESIKSMGAQLLITKNQIEQMKLACVNNEPTGILKREDVTKSADDHRKAIKNIFLDISKVKNEVNKIMNKIGQAETAKAQTKRDQEIKEWQQLSKINQEFIDKQKEQISKFKDEVAAKRKEKNIDKKPIIEQKSPHEEKKILLKNPEMKDRLESLSVANLQLIIDILSFTKSVKYQDVYYLISNQLGGKIIEIGNGSSHKRIELDKYYTEIISHSATDGADETKLQENKVVGGIVKPHGKSHNSGILSKFNIKLVADVFKKANIRLVDIEELLRIKLESNQAILK